MLLLSHGSVIDGSGAEAVSTSVLLSGDRIAAIGPDLRPTDVRTIDCTGLTVTPGFFDLHSHSDLQVLENRTEKLKQGVTTEVVGNCGFSPFPYADDPSELRGFAAGILGRGDEWGWPTADAYCNALAALGADSRGIPLVGHGSLRIAIHGLQQTALSGGEMDRLCGLVADALGAGCAGLSTGLMYAPGSCATVDELLPLCLRVARRDKLYASHIRSYATGLVDAVREQIQLAELSGCRLQISHLQAAGRQNWHLQQQALEEIESARHRGVDVEFDIYPYQCGSTVLTQFVPQWALDGGTQDLLLRLREQNVRRRLLSELSCRSEEEWADITVSSLESAANESLIGHTIAEIASLRSTSGAEVVLDLLAEENGAVNVVSFNQSLPNLRQLITHPLCSVITDGFYVKGKPHPRLHGTYPELLGRMVRELSWLSLPQAIHKSTAQPAARVKMRDLGFVRAGYLADLVVFSADRVASPATYAHPQADPQGVALVIKRGDILWEAKNVKVADERGCPS